MPYLGNTPAEAYTSFDKQTITGNGGTSYTLDHAVGNEQEIEVFVNNVRQEPSVAYTVSGTALTMTGNVESSDDFYVVFQGKATQTTTHPETFDLKAVNGTFTGDVTAVDSTFSGDVDVTGALDVDGLVKLGKNDGTVDARVIFECNNSDGDGWIGIPSWDTDAVHIYSPNGSGGNAQRMIFTDDGNVRITGGLYVGGSASANLLDDYEEGTWTPTVTTATSVESQSAGYGAHYTKIGNLVTFQVYMSWTNSTNNNSSLFQIGGLPFTSISDYGSFNVGFVGSANMNDAVGVVNINTNKLYFHQNDGSIASIKNSDIHSRGLTTIILTGSYFAA